MKGRLANRADPISDAVEHGVHYENMPIKIYWKFYHQKMKIFG